MSDQNVETVAYWSVLIAAVLSVVTAVATALAFYASSRFVAARDAQFAALRAESQAAISSAETRAAEADGRAATTSATAAAAAARIRELEFDIAERDRSAARGTRIPAGGRAEAQVSNGRSIRSDSTPLELQAASAEMRLDPKQREAMVSVLKQAASPRHVQLSWVATTASYGFAKDVWGVLEAAGWQVTAAGGVFTPFAPMAVSMLISVLSDDTVWLESAFEAVHIDLSVAIERTVPEGQIKLIIGDNQERALRDFR